MKMLVLFLSLTFVYSHRYFNGLNIHMKQRKTNLDEISGKFGSSRQDIFRLMPLYYQQPLAMQNPPCLPQIWTCGPGLPPCCPGLWCYHGNAKRGRHCVWRR